MEEQALFDEAGLFVSQSRILTNGTTYSTANVTSVSMSFTPPDKGCPLTLIGIGTVGLFLGLALLTDSPAPGMGSLVIAGVMLAAGIWWFRSLKPTYHVVFRSVSGEVEALSSQNRSLVERFVEAVNAAIVARG